MYNLTDIIILITYSTGISLNKGLSVITPFLKSDPYWVSYREEYQTREQSSKALNRVNYFIFIVIVDSKKYTWTHTHTHTRTHTHIHMINFM